MRDEHELNAWLEDVEKAFPGTVSRDSGSLADVPPLPSSSNGLPKHGPRPASASDPARAALGQPDEPEWLREARRAHAASNRGGA